MDLFAKAKGARSDDPRAILRAQAREDGVELREYNGGMHVQCRVRGSRAPAGLAAEWWPSNGRVILFNSNGHVVHNGIIGSPAETVSMLRGHWRDVASAVEAGAVEAEEVQERRAQEQEEAAERLAANEEAVAGPGDEAPPDIVFTGDQERALAMISEFRKNAGAMVARLTGFAGTGKTTIIREIVRRVKHEGKRVQVLAPTGKAALRVQEATGCDASTIHRFIYNVKVEYDTGNLDFRSKGSSHFSSLLGGLVVVDEASMVTEKIWDDLKATSRMAGFKILLVGDPFQLEPVEPAKNGAPFSFVRNIEVTHQAELREILRQKADDPIIKATMALRAAKTQDDFKRAIDGLPRLPAGETPASVCARTGAPVIVHRNATRHSINADVRRRLGRAAQTVPGDLLLVTKNTYAVDMFNGEIVEFGGYTDNEAHEGVAEKPSTGARAPVTFRRAIVGGKNVVVCNEQIAGEIVAFGSAGKEVLTDHFITVAWEKVAQRAGLEHCVLLHVNYGYALTCHKSQGSEWDEVVAVVESSLDRPRKEKDESPEERLRSKARWCYTALTRAKTRVLWTNG